MKLCASVPPAFRAIDSHAQARECACAESVVNRKFRLDVSPFVLVSSCLWQVFLVYFASYTLFGLLVFDFVCVWATQVAPLFFWPIFIGVQLLLKWQVFF
jgi:hypothetical protein